MKNVVFWDVAPCGSCKNRRFGVVYRLHHQVDKNRRTRKDVNLVSVLVTAKVVPTSTILVNLIMESLLSSETSVLTRAMMRKIP
jgi:hypothetical protein